MIRTVLIDDEKHCNETLAYFLSKQAGDLQILETFTESREALDFLKKVPVDLVFLDIQMPTLNGFDLLDLLIPFDFQVVFVTAFDQYAIKAIKYAALDYIQKPVDPDELKSVLKEIKEKKQAEIQAHFFKELNEVILSRPKNLERICLPTSAGYVFIDLKEIVWIEASGNYSTIKCSNSHEYVNSKSLKNLLDTLEDPRFVRVHNSFAVNKNAVKSLVRADGGYLIMTDGRNIPLSRTRKDSLLDDLIS